MQAAAMSEGLAKRPSGMLAMNFALFSGVSGTPIKASRRAVSPITGATQFTRIFEGASSTAKDFDAKFTAPLDPLYQVRPGRGRIPAVEPMLIIDPPPCWLMTGTTAFVMWKMDLTFIA